MISEGVAALVLKRLADAERDGDRIYAVIKGVGASSDGRARGLTAPVVEGQMRALERAYAKAGVSPATVGYVEAHGTGTALGDVVEIEALGQLFREAGANRTRMRRGLGQVADRPHQVRRRAGRADQRLAGALSQGLAADDRNRDPQPQARPARRPVPALHAGAAVAPSATPTGRAAPGSAPSGSAARTSTPSSRRTTATSSRSPSRR